MFSLFSAFHCMFSTTLFSQGTKEGSEIHNSKEQKWVNGSVHDQQYSSCSGTVVTALHFAEF